MFSSDKNIDTIGQLIETLIHYVKLQNEYLRLTVVEKVVRVAVAVAMVVAVFLFLLIAIIYFSFAAAYALEDVVGGLPQAFCVVGAFYVVLLIVVYLLRRVIIERPLVKLLSNILFKK